MKKQDKVKIPDHLIEEFIAGNVVIFAGAGVSTGIKKISPPTLYESISYDLGYEDCKKSFPELMSEYCKKSNGRIKLLEKIRQRFQNIRSFRELYDNATEFYREIATIPFIDTIVTTNWDTYFEDEMKAIPFVNSEDTAFWNTDSRKVLKIHGSITNYGSMIITEEDYKECFDKLHSNLIGSILKTLLSTKTILFIGYSLNDSDFNEIYNYIKTELGKFTRDAYIITLSDKNENRFKEIGLTPFNTDATYFMRCVKEKLVEKEEMMTNDHIVAAKGFYNLFCANHISTSKKYDYHKYPSVIYCTSYQDGVIHALERSFEMKKTGEYHNEFNLISTIDWYQNLRKERLKEKNYFDVAYIDGYMVVHSMYLLFDKTKIETTSFPPLFYIFGKDENINDVENFAKLLKQTAKIHKSSFNWARIQIKKIAGDSNNSETVLHHPAFL